MAREKNPYTVVRGDVDGEKGWLVVGPELAEPAGPYETKKEALDAANGLKRFGKEYEEVFRREQSKKTKPLDDQSFAEQKEHAVENGVETTTEDRQHSESEAQQVVTKKKSPSKKKSTASKRPAKKKPSTSKNGNLSQLDAAAKVLQKAKEPLGCKEMIDNMEKQGLWKSPGGKTPDRTLYSALLREIDKKGKDSRFKKSGKGKFALKA